MPAQTPWGSGRQITKTLFSKKGISWQTVILKSGEGMPMDLLVFPHVEGDPFEKIPVARLPVSGIYFSFTNLIFIPTFLEESFWATVDATFGILSWDQISFCSALRKSKERKSNGLLQSLTSIGLRCSMRFLLI